MLLAKKYFLLMHSVLSRKVVLFSANPAHFYPGKDSVQRPSMNNSRLLFTWGQAKATASFRTVEGSIVIAREEWDGYKYTNT